MQTGQLGQHDNIALFKYRWIGQPHPDMRQIGTTALSQLDFRTKRLTDTGIDVEVTELCPGRGRQHQAHQGHYAESSQHTGPFVREAHPTAWVQRENPLFSSHHPRHNIWRSIELGRYIL